jgi:hypothetical protein
MSVSRLKMTLPKLDKLDPKAIAVSSWIGSNDILTETGDELIERFQEDGEGPDDAKFSDAFRWFLEDFESGNSWDVTFIKDGRIRIADLWIS